MVFLPRPNVSGNPSIQAWDELRREILNKIRNLQQYPTTEDEILDIMDDIPRIYGIGDYSYSEAIKWLIDYYGIKPDA